VRKSGRLAFFLLFLVLTLGRLAVLPAAAQTADPRAAYLMGLAASNAGDLANAETYLRQAFRMSPRNSEVISALAEVLLKTDRPQPALQAYRQAIRFNPENRSAYYGAGFAYLRLKQMKLAERQYEEITVRFPDEEQAWLVLADLYTASNQNRKAVDAYHRILEARPNVPLLHYNLGLIHTRLRDYPKALEATRKTLELSPDFLPAAHLAARIYQETGRNVEAESIYRELLKRFPQDRSLLLSLAQIYSEQERWTAAAVHLNRLVMTGAAEPEILLLQGLIFQKEGQWERALNSYRAVLEKKPDPKIRFQTAVALDKLGRDTEAVAELRKVVAEAPEDHVALNYLGYTLVLRGENLNEAEALIKRAVDLDPRNGAYLDSLGWVYFKKGDLRRAGYYLEKAGRLEPDPEIFGHLAELYQKLGQPQKAAAYRQKILEMPPREE